MTVSSSTVLAAKSSGDDERERALAELAKYHPVIVEGMGWYDPRDPKIVASNIVAGIQAHLQKAAAAHSNNNDKPLLVISQGDPLTETGISAITPLVAESLSGSHRGLVILDDSIAPYHTRDADRTNILAEIKYSALVEILRNNTNSNNNNNNNTNNNNNNILEALEASIDAHIVEQNNGRALVGKPPVKDYFKTFALLQEVTKAGLKELCGGITVAHTSSEINEFSVTSFYKVGLSLGLYDQDTELVAYDDSFGQTAKQEEPLDFAVIDPR